MTLRTFFSTLILLLVGLTASFAALAQGSALTEKAKIEALISHLETLQDATFIRNGTEYDSKSAAKFLQKKWQANEGEIHSAADFIIRVATRSSTTGKPYLIQIKGGFQGECANYLTAELKKLEAAR